MIKQKHSVMLTHDKITEIYCIADDFCKEFAQEIKKYLPAIKNAGIERLRSIILS